MFTDMFIDDFGLTLLSIAIIVIFGASILIINSNRRYRRFVESIKPGDMFVYDSRIDSYYRELDNYKNELNNPFRTYPYIVIFPKGTCVVKELKTDVNGEIWVLFKDVSTPTQLDETNDDNTYSRQLADFLDFRTRVKRFEK